MEYHLEIKRNPVNQEASDKIYGQSSHQASQSTKLGDRFKLDRLGASSADFHPELVRKVDNGPQKSTGFHRKQQSERKADELIRYMSNLPSYLKKGGKHQAKAFNVGVLDWHRLERWQNNHQQFPQQSCTSSPASSNTSSFSPTEGTSSYSSRGHSCSPTGQRMDCTILESSLHASPNNVCSHDIKCSAKNGFRSHDGIALSSNYLKVQQSILKTHQSYNQCTKNKLEECKAKQSDLPRISDNRKSGESKNESVASISKGKLMVQDCGNLERKEKLQGADCNHTDKHCMNGKQTAVFLLPKERQEIKSHSSFNQSDSTREHHLGQAVASQRDISNESESKADELSSDISSLSCPADDISHPQIEQPISTQTRRIPFSSEMSQLSALSTNIAVTSVRGKKLEEKKSNKTLHNSIDGPKLKTDTIGDSKVRNPSPIRRISFITGRMGKGSSSKDISSMPQSNHHTGKFGSGEAEIYVSSVDLSCDKSNPNDKARSSPSSRLLDPLFKPKVGTHYPGSSQVPLAQIDMASKISNGRAEASALHSVKVKLDLGSCKTINIDHPHDLGKCKSTIAQALLHVGVKNGLPLFTFAVENSSDILAATVRKQNTGRNDGSSWIYTFFTISEMKKKKKNGNWLNHGNKDRSHGLMPNIVGQMKVSDVPTTDLVRQNSGNHYSIREFILFAMNAKQADQQTSELQANNELAAIVLKQPKMTSRNSNEVHQKNCDLQEPSIVDSKVESQGCSCSDSRNAEDSVSSAGSINHFGLFVILPGADHGLPTKGKPSSLIERWRLGGSCDCGGWDLGCRLRVLASQTHSSRKSISHKAQSSTRKFQLYSQEPALDREPIFSLTLFKDGIYSVEFDSSLKCLQAFSICIAVLNGMKPAEFSALSNFVEMKSSEDITLLETDEAKVSNRDQ